MTIEELCEKCKKEIKNGNGNRDIILCINDDEFYLLKCGFSSPVLNRDNIYYFIEKWDAEEDSVIVLN